MQPRVARPRAQGRLALAATALLVFFAAAAFAQDVSEETVDYFNSNCASCHTVGGGPLAGPDLKGATDRKDIEWVARFIQDPKAVIDSGDAYAQKLLRESRGVYMPTLPGLSMERATKLAELIKVESAKEKSRFAGTQVSDRPLTAADVERGRRLYDGRDSFENGGPACIACHDVAGIAAFGGGRLGPDLTDVYSRLEGRKALAAWMSAPPAATMQPIYADHELSGDEILSLVAYLKSTAETGQSTAGHGPLAFLIAGVVGLVLILVLFDVVWRRRFRGVRRALVKAHSGKGSAA